jgi:hypothetical protein
MIVGASIPDTERPLLARIVVGVPSPWSYRYRQAVEDSIRPPPVCTTRSPDGRRDVKTP